MPLSPLLTPALRVPFRHIDSVFKIESGAWVRPRTSEVHRVLVHNSHVYTRTECSPGVSSAQHVQVLSSCASFYSNCVGTLTWIAYDSRRLALSRYPPCDYHLTTVICCFTKSTCRMPYRGYSYVVTVVTFVDLSDLEVHATSSSPHFGHTQSSTH